MTKNNQDQTGSTKPLPSEPQLPSFSILQRLPAYPGFWYDTPVKLAFFLFLSVNVILFRRLNAFHMEGIWLANVFPEHATVGESGKGNVFHLATATFTINCHPFIPECC